MTVDVEADELAQKPRIKDVLNPRLVLLLGSGLLSTTAMYMVVPFMSIYFHGTLHLSVAITGMLVGLPFLSSLVFGVVGGLLTDRLGVLRSFVTAQAVFALALGSIGLTHSVGIIATLLIIYGAAMPVTLSGAQTLANEAAQPEHRGTVQNYLYWISNAGVILGLLVSAEVLSGGHSPTVFFALGAVRLIATGAVMIGFVGRLKPSATASSKPIGLIATIKTASTDQALLFATLTMLLLIFMESQLTSTVPIDIVSHFSQGSKLFGPLLAIDSVVIVIFQPMALKWIPAKRPLLWFGLGAVATGGGLALGGTVNTLSSWIVGMLLYSFGEVLWASKLNDLLGDLPTEGNSSLYFATVVTGQNLAMFLGMTVGATLLKLPNILFGGMIVVGLLAAVAYRYSVRGLRLRTMREQAVLEQVTQAPVPGAAAPLVTREAEAGAVMTQGLGAFYAPQGGSVGSDFGIPMPKERMVLLADLSEQEWARLMQFSEVQMYSQGDLVVERATSERALYLVEEGALEVLVSDQHDRERRLTLIERGAVFGEQAFIDGQPRSASIRGVTNGTLRKLEWAGFRKLAGADPEMAERLLTDLARILSERLRKTTEYLNLWTGA